MKFQLPVSEKFKKLLEQTNFILLWHLNSWKISLSQDVCFIYMIITNGSLWINPNWWEAGSLYSRLVAGTQTLACSPHLTRMR